MNKGSLLGAVLLALMVIGACIIFAFLLAYQPKFAALIGAFIILSICMAALTWIFYEIIELVKS